MNDGETGVFNDSIAVESVAVDCCKPVETDEKLDRQSSAESGIQAWFTFNELWSIRLLRTRWFQNIIDLSHSNHALSWGKFENQNQNI